MSTPLASRRAWMAKALSIVSLTREARGNPCPNEQNMRMARELLSAAVERNELPGAVALVAHPNCQSAVLTAGWQDIEMRTQLSERSIFDIRSITKPVTALAALAMVDRERLYLDRPITDVLPDARTSKWAYKVTLRHLLTHTSGLGQERPKGLDGLTESRDVPLADVARRVLEMPLRGKTGGSWRYSSPGYCLVGRLIEVAAGMSFARFVAEAVLRPLGMRETYFLPPNEVRHRLASLYEWKDGKIISWPRRLPADQWAYESPDFGLYSTVGDVDRLLEAVSSEGFSLLKPGLRELMLTPGVPTEVPGLSQGLGWMVARTDEPQRLLGIRAGCFGHNGAGGSMAWANRVTRTRAVFLSQCFNNPSSSGGAGFMRLAHQPS